MPVRVRPDEPLRVRVSFVEVPAVSLPTKVTLWTPLVVKVIVIPDRAEPSYFVKPVPVVTQVVPFTALVVVVEPELTAVVSPEVEGRSTVLVPVAVSLIVPPMPEKLIVTELPVALPTPFAVGVSTTVFPVKVRLELVVEPVSLPVKVTAVPRSLVNRTALVPPAVREVKPESVWWLAPTVKVVVGVVPVTATVEATLKVTAFELEPVIVPSILL